MFDTRITLVFYIVKVLISFLYSKALDLLNTHEELYIYTGHWLVWLLEIWAGNKLYLFDFRSSPTKKKGAKGSLILGNSHFSFNLPFRMGKDEPIYVFISCRNMWIDF